MADKTAAGRLDLHEGRGTDRSIDSALGARLVRPTTEPGDEGSVPSTEDGVFFCQRCGARGSAIDGRVAPVSRDDGDRLK